MMGNILYKLLGVLHWVSCVFLKIFFKTFGRLKVKGVKYIKDARPTVFLLPTHSSFWDPLIVGAICPLNSKVFPYCFVAKSELNKGAHGWILKHLGNSIYIESAKEMRESGVKPKRLRQNLKKVANVLHLGVGSMVIFPEGKRNDGKNIERIKRGVGYLTGQTNKPVIPIAISGQKKAHLLEFLTFRRKLRAVVGEPFHLQTLMKNPKDFKEAGETLQKILQGLLDQTKHI